MTQQWEPSFRSVALVRYSVLAAMLLFASVQIDAAPRAIATSSGSATQQASLNIEAEGAFADPHAPLGAAEIRSWSALTNAENFPPGHDLGQMQLPENVQAMLKATQELQTIRSEYETTVENLIQAAKRLEDSPSATADVAALAKKAEQLRQQAAAKQHALWKAASRGAFLNKAFGQRSFGSTHSEEPSPDTRGGINMWPITPRSEFLQPQYDALP